MGKVKITDNHPIHIDIKQSIYTPEVLRKKLSNVLQDRSVSNGDILEALLCLSNEVIELKKEIHTLKYPTE